MHELSICGSIADIVIRRAGERPVATIHLRVGRLRQVVPQTLTYCWDLISADTELAGSVLDIESVPATITCRDCGHLTEIGELPLFMCSACSGVQVSVVSGEEFLVTALDLAEV